MRERVALFFFYRHFCKSAHVMMPTYYNIYEWTSRFYFALKRFVYDQYLAREMTPKCTLRGGKKITFRGSRYKIRLFSRQLYSSRCFLLSVYYISLSYFPSRLMAVHCHFFFYARQLKDYTRSTAQNSELFRFQEVNTVSLRNRILKFRRIRSPLSSHVTRVI